MRNNHDVSLPVRRSQGAGTPSAWNDGSRLIDPLLHPASFFGGSPFQLMRRMHEDMDRLFAQTIGGIPASEAGGASAREGFAPSMDISETDQEYCIEIDLPGVRPENVDLQVQEGTLTLRASMRDEGKTAEPTAQNEAEQRRYHARERRYGYFERTLSLPPNIDEQGIRAEFNHGVLTLHLTKTQPEQPKARRIPIEGASADAGMTGTQTGEQKSDENAGKAG